MILVQKMSLVAFAVHDGEHTLSSVQLHVYMCFYIIDSKKHDFSRP